MSRAKTLEELTLELESPVAAVSNEAARLILDRALCVIELDLAARLAALEQRFAEEKRSTSS